MPRMGLTLEAIERAAEQIADTRGYDAVSVSAVARALSVRPASLYAHLTSKQDLLGRLHRRALDRLGNMISDATVGASGRQALEEYCNAHRRLAAAHPGAWQALHRTADDETVGSESAQRVARLSLAVLRGYGLSETAAVHATRLVGATINGFVSLESAGSIRHRHPEADVSWTAAIAALDRALRTWPGGESPNL